MNNFYVTTPIYYVNGDPHVGSAYTTIASDVMARYQKLAGKTVYFLTGTDEHGQKVEQTAHEKGFTPQAWTDKMAPAFTEMWKALNIKYSDFIRTTEPRHKNAVKKILKAVYDKGDIYKGEYEGQYCISCETFFPENQIVEPGHCPDCGKKLSTVKEESYFFKMSKYQEALLQHIEEHPDFILPHSRRNEVISFIKQGLQDLSISRNTFSWGIPIEFAPGHITYVWFDALTNYLTAVGYENDPEKFETYWNHARVCHLIGKDIIRFHAIIWPCMLLSAGIKLPDSIVAHGWWTSEGEKMSKSKGNVVNPYDEIKKYGVDAFRYYLLREANFGSDGDYSTKGIIGRINSDLANDLGNLLNRTLGMYHKYFQGKIVSSGEIQEIEIDVYKLWENTLSQVETHMYYYEYSKALEVIWKFISRMNKYIDETMPWALAKEETQQKRLATVMNTLLESLYKIAVLVSPFIPEAAQKIWNQLGISEDVEKAQLQSLHCDVSVFESIFPIGHDLGKANPIFPRIELVEEEESKADPMQVNPDLIIENPIDIDYFKKTKIQVVEILEVSKVKGADKLLKFKVSVGDHVRQILSAIAEYYPNVQELKGAKILAVTNLKPRKMRGEISQGMLLTTEDEQGICQVIQVPKNTAAGTEVE
ncbi:methionine--tRNA ligase [Fusobacterium necrophorum]|uniref:methionine--tRNA ligase n=1 Tax=Fusobacterium necrophorum TaxID=859 RepID=UPI003F9F151A